MTVLPVRPTPRPSEPLSSYAVRLADANGIPRGRVLPRYRHDIDIPARELDVVASLAGLDDGAARQLTMNRYPLAIRGHGIQRRHGWRRPSTSKCPCGVTSSASRKKRSPWVSICPATCSIRMRPRRAVLRARNCLNCRRRANRA